MLKGIFGTAGHKQGERQIANSAGVSKSAYSMKSTRNSSPVTYSP